MLLPAHRVLDALNNEFIKLQPLFSDSKVDGSAGMSIACAMQQLRNREEGGVPAVRQQFDRFDAVIAKVCGLVGTAEPAIIAEMEALRKTFSAAKAMHGQLEIEAAWLDAVTRQTDIMSRLVVSKAVSPAIKKTIAQLLVAWESADLMGQAAAEKSAASAASVEVTAENLAVYLRDRFNERGMKVTLFQPLAGGFGKQTILFDVEGKALSGGFVMRRDMGNVPTVANDCHMIKQEYPVIKAAAARGFPAPDALWLDTDHKLLPGWDFIIMRRAPGKVPGNFFGAQTQVPPGLTDELADIMSRLHRLPPMTELGDLTESIRSESWKLTKAECTARYIRNWYDLYMNAEHWPSPSLMAIFGWLFDNVPDRKGPPSMLHGDVGFHNFLFDEGKLSAVVDWEFAHVGDPAEEIGMVKVTTGASINWEQLMTRYLAGGGKAIDDKTLHYFQVWGYARNAAASNIVSAKFIKGQYNELKLAFLPVGHFPHFIQHAQALIDKAP